MEDIQEPILYTFEDIQQMLDECYANEELTNAVLNKITDINDCRSIKSVISTHWVEDFYRFDSGVCEQFIQVYELSVQELA